MPSKKYEGKINAAEMEWICEQHGVGKFQEVVRSFHSKTNENFLIKTSKGNFVIRYFKNPISLERIDYVQNILLYLKENDIPVVCAIKNKTSDFITSINKKNIQVTPFIEAFLYNKDIVQIKSSAKMLNKFHNVLTSYRQGPLPSFSIHPTNQRLENELSQLYKKKDLHTSITISKIKNMNWKVLNRLEKFPTTGLPKTIIHDDWHSKNLLYQKDGSVACILDYDGLQRAERVYDVAYALYVIHTSSPSKYKKNFTKAFLNEYGELLPEEEELIPLIMAKSSLWFLSYLRDYPKALDSFFASSKPFIDTLINSNGTNFLD